MSSPARALADLLWNFFPVVIVIVVLWITGTLDHITERSDLLLVASVLFADGSWRLRQGMIGRPRHLAQMIGLVGAMIAVILASAMLLKEAMAIPELARVVQSSRFQWMQWITLVTATFYGFYARLISIWNERFRLPIDD